MKTILALLVLTLANFSFATNDKISYSYTLWIGDNATTKHFIHLNSDKGIKFIDAMDEAAAKDFSYAYDFIQYSFGKLITKIGGQSQDPSK